MQANLGDAAAIAAARQRFASGEGTAAEQRSALSIVAPADPVERLEVSVWAALIARINQSTGKVAGYINPRLYQNPQALRDLTQGGNGDFTAQIGWDACTGLGSPNGKAPASII